MTERVRERADTRWGLRRVQQPIVISGIQSLDGALRDGTQAPEIVNLEKHPQKGKCTRDEWSPTAFNTQLGEGRATTREREKENERGRKAHHSKGWPYALNANELIDFGIHQNREQLPKQVNSGTREERRRMWGGGDSRNGEQEDRTREKTNSGKQPHEPLVALTPSDTPGSN
jgi:hypothetical protein